LTDITVGWEIVEICTGMAMAGMGTDIAGIPWGWKWHLQESCGYALETHPTIKIMVQALEC